MIIQIAWKNIWRNKLRSLVVIMAIAIGLLAGIVSVAFMNGAIQDRVDAAINNEVSSLQLHNPEFLKNSDATALIPKANELMLDIESRAEVAALAGRLKLEAMLNHGHGPRGAIVLGIDPEMERNLTNIAACIADSNGTWFESDKRNPMVISTRLAEKLKVKLNGKIQVDAVSKNGQATASVFRVVGIYQTENSMFDELNVFVHRQDLQEIFEFGKNDIHEIAILNKEMMETDSTELYLREKYTRYEVDSTALLSLNNAGMKPYIYTYYKSLLDSASYSYHEFDSLFNKNVNPEDQEANRKDIFDACERDVNVMSWGELAPDVQLTTYWMDLLLYIFVGIILLALGFGIINTMLMVVLERVKELGMLMAIGMNRRRVYRMVVIETVVLSLVGGFVGILLSSLTVAWMSVNGIDLSMMSDGLNAMGFSTKIYPTIGMDSYIKVVIMVVVTGILAALYPAFKAVKLNPAEAVRSE
jgi:putative ABC transport system permease protein